MVTMKSVEKQLKKIGFNHHSWGRSEVRELPNILLEDEEVFECVNGTYEGGFALLVATNIRVLLIDKKPLNYLTVEDLRFDMISEIDYSHRLLGAHISMSAGSKNLKFTSYNQPRLRKLITHVQHCMADKKKQQSEQQEDQNTHLEQINERLQAYLLAQHQTQEQLREQLRQQQAGGTASSGKPLAEPELPRPDPQLADYLYAQSLLAQHRAKAAQPVTFQPAADVARSPAPPAHQLPAATAASPHLADLYAEGMQEVFSKRPNAAAEPTQPVSANLPANSDRRAVPAPLSQMAAIIHNPLEINPLTIAYSKLPMALRNRRFGRPSFHSHSQAAEFTAKQAPAAGNV